MEKMNKRRRMFLFFITPVLIVIQFIIGYFIILQILQISKLEDQHSRTEKYLRNQLTSLINAETGQRGFLLTNKPEYLEPYHLGLKQLTDNDTMLQYLNGLDKIDQFKELERLKANKLAIMKQTIALSMAGRKDSAMAIVGTNRGKLTMDSIRANIDVYLEGVFLTIANARAELRSLIILFIVVMIVLLLFQMFFSLYAHFVFTRFSKDILKLVDDLEESNQSLMDFTYMCYHQLKEPLRSISGFIKLIVKRNSATFDNESHDFANQAMKATEQMGTTINTLREKHLKRKEA